jgi:hypothetical protein
MQVHRSERARENSLGGLLKRPVVAVAVLFIACAGAFAWGGWAQRQGLTAMWIRVAKQRLAVPQHAWQGFLTKPIPLTLDIKHKHVKKLDYVRQGTDDNDGLLITVDADDDFVPATLTAEGTRYDVKIRNKGNWRDARTGEKWSLRVKLKDGKTVLGMGRFSLHAPATKGDLGEWFFHRWLAHLGLVSMHYDFVNLTVNGKDLGIHAIEESFSRRLIEHNERREGVLVRFDEYWTYYFMYYKKVQVDSLPEIFALSAIGTYETERVLANPALHAQFITAQSLLEAFRRGERTTAEVFDVDKVAKLFAITDVLGHDHNLELRNIKFYYNPITSKLEPVGYDQHLPITIRRSALVGGHRQMHGPYEKMIWLDHFFRDPTFYAAYLAALEAISAPGYFDNFMASLDGEFQRVRALMYREDPSYDVDDAAIMRENIAIITRKLKPLKAIDGFLASEGNGVAELQLVNIHVQPVQVVGVTLDGVDLPLEGTATWPILEAKAPNLVMPYATLRVQLPAPDAAKDAAPDAAKDAAKDAVKPVGLAERLAVRWKIFGTAKTEQRATVRPWAHIDPAFLRSDFMRRPANHAEFDFVEVDAKLRVIRLRPGQHKLRKPLILPSGFEIIAGEGVELDLLNGALILSRSPVRFVGSAARPIVVRSSDKTGQGFAVLTNGERSVLRFVHFEDLGNPTQKGWSMPGAVTFHEGIVQIQDCVFARNRSEDGLNLVRSQLDIERARFEKTQADAFDCDFCNGEIRDSVFVDVGNDGVDVSGSTITLTRVTIDGSGDKAVSAGEGSTMTVKDVKVRRSELALCSKDRSTLVADGVDIDTTRVGFAVFIKKAEFGAARLSAERLTLAQLERVTLVEKGSSMSLEGKVQAPTHENVKEILYGAEYGKSSR